MLEAFVDFVAKGITNEAVNKLQDEFGDSYQPGQGFKDAGSEKLDELIESWTPEWMVRVGTLIGKINDARKAQIKKKCAEETLTDELRNDCIKWEVHPEVFSTINWAKFIPGKAITGQPVKLEYFIGGSAGSKHAKVNTVTIDWGDGKKTSSFVFNPRYPNVWAFYGKSTQHTYILPSISDKEYTAKITVAGDNDPDESHVHFLEVPIRVTAAKDPLSVRFLNGDKLLDINEPGTWKVEVRGGVPPYDIDMEWGDNNTISRDNSYIEKYKTRHRYTEAKQYTIRFTAYDARYFSKSTEFIVAVGNPDSGEGETVPTTPNWDNNCGYDNSENSGGATAIWSLGDSQPYTGRGLICSDRGGDLWMFYTGVVGGWLLVKNVGMGGAHPTWTGCFLKPQIALDAGAVIGGSWICPIQI